MSDTNAAAPELAVSRWFNTSEPLTLAALKGRPVFIHAFQMLCPGCVAHGTPQAQRVHDLFRRTDLQVIGLHTVFEHHAAMSPVSLEAFISEYRLTFPVGVDEAGEGTPIPVTMVVTACRARRPASWSDATAPSCITGSVRRATWRSAPSSRRNFRARARRWSGDRHKTRKGEVLVTEPKPALRSAFQAIRAIDYTVIFARDMAAMRHFYEDVLGFALLRELSPDWIEYRIGDNTLALATPKRTAADVPMPHGTASLQLAFRVSASEVDQCADELVRHGVDLLSPPTDQTFGHRTLFFRDPDGNLLEVFAEI